MRIQYCEGCGQRFSDDSGDASKQFCVNCIAAGKCPIVRAKAAPAAPPISRTRRPSQTHTPAEKPAQKNQTLILAAGIAGACVVLGLVFWLLMSPAAPSTAPAFTPSKPANPPAVVQAPSPPVVAPAPSNDPPKTPEARPGGLSGMLAPTDNSDIDKWRAESAGRAIEAARKYAKENPDDVVALRATLNQLATRYSASPAGKEAAKWVAELKPPGNGKWPEGFIWREVWPNIYGDKVSDLTSQPAYFDKPSDRQQTYFLGAGPSGDGYGARFRGFIHAPADGAYTFWIASDNGSELWLSSSNNPFLKKLVAACPHEVGEDNWETQPEQRSKPVTLAKGQRYFFEVLHKQGGGNNFVRVGWQLPNGTFERPIQGLRLSPFDENAMAEWGPDYAVSALEEARKNAKENPDDVVALRAKLNQLATQFASYPAGKEAAKWASELVVPGKGKWPEGFVWRECWTNIPGDFVSDLTGHPAFLGKTGTRTKLTALAGPVKSGEEFGARIRGYIHAPMDGAYTFWILSDDASEFWLSSGEDAAQIKKVAAAVKSVGFGSWEMLPEQKSAPVTLAKGQRYYFEVLHKQGHGDDFVSVGWQLPNQAMERPIQGMRLSPLEKDNAAP